MRSKTKYNHQKTEISTRNRETYKWRLLCDNILIKAVLVIYGNFIRRPDLLGVSCASWLVATHSFDAVNPVRLLAFS